MAARQLKNTGYRAMDGTLYAVYMPKFLRNYKFLFIVFYIWYIAFIESYYFLCVKKTIEHIYQNMYLLICILIVMAF